MWHRAVVFVVLCLLTLTLVPSAIAQQEKITVSKEPTTLVWHNREIFVFRAEMGEFTPPDRASAATKVLDSIEIGAVAPEVTVQPILGAMAIRVGERPVFFIVEEDLGPDETLSEAAAEVSKRITEALDAYARSHSWQFLLAAGTEAAVATIVFLVVFLVLYRVSRVLRRRLPSPESPKLQRLRVTGFPLGQYAAGVLRGIVGFTFLVLEAFALYLWVTYVLQVFPYTRPWGEASADFLIALGRDLLVGLLSGVPGLITVLAIFWVTRLFLRVIGRFFDVVEDRSIEVTWLQPETSGATRRLVVAVVWIFAITVAYPYIPGSDSAAFKGVSVFVGLMVSLGSAGLINQVMSGLVVVYSRAFKPGEVIRVGDVDGVVTEIGVLSTKVITPKLEEVTIPNAVLVNTATKNFSSVSKDDGVILYTSITIGYDTPWRQVHAMMLLAAERTEGVRTEPKPFVLQRALDDWYVEYQLNVHMVDPKGRVRVLSQLHANIQDVFNEFGVQIMSPHFIAQPDQLIVSPKEKWYEAPAQRPPESAG
jgi:small-conductance mechanosensitive channel